MERHRASEEELYYFDLRGYLVVRGALSAKVVDECNAALDRHWDRGIRRVDGLARDAAALKGDEGRFEMTGMLGWSEPERAPRRHCRSGRSIWR